MLKKFNKTIKLVTFDESLENLNNKKKPNFIKTNIKYFNALDGVYNSYWLGKFINTFILKGKKKMITKFVYKSLIQLKFSQHNIPIISILEIIDKIKPSLKLVNRFQKRRMLAYPKAIKKNKQYAIALFWLKNEVNSHENISRIKYSISNRIYNKLLEFKIQRKHNLLKKRDQYHLDAIRLQQNIRYTWYK